MNKSLDKSITFGLAIYILIGFLQLITLGYLYDVFLTGSYILLLNLMIYSRGKAFSLLYFYGFLLFATNIPFLLYHLGLIEDIFLKRGMRTIVLNVDNYRLGSELTIMSSLIFMSFIIRSNPKRIQIFKNFDKGNLYVEIILLGLTYLINKDSQFVLGEGIYSGDGYVEGESFGGWSPLFIIFISVYIFKTSLKSIRSQLFIFLIVIIWFLFGNRGEIFAIIYFVVYSKVYDKIKIPWKKALTYVLVIASAFYFIGIFRSKRTFDDNINYIQVFSNNFTLTPVDYTLMCGIEDVKNNGLLYGELLLNYFKRVTPSFLGFERPLDTSNYLNDNYDAIGGIHFLTEPYMDFGILGVFVHSYIFCFAMSYFERKLSKNKTEYIIIVIVLFFLGIRTMWYGYITSIKVFFVLIPLIVIYRYVQNKKKHV